MIDFLSVSHPVLGLETSCPASDPYDNFTLSCTASKPSNVISALIVVWYHNGSVIDRGTIYTFNGMSTYVTNTLVFLNSTVTDSGNYTCRTSIDILNSTMIERIAITTVTLRGKMHILMYVNIAYYYSCTLSIYPN